MFIISSACVCVWLAVWIGLYMPEKVQHKHTVSSRGSAVRHKHSGPFRRTHTHTHLLILYKGRNESVSVHCSANPLCKWNLKNHACNFSSKFHHHLAADLLQRGTSHTAWHCKKEEGNQWMSGWMSVSAPHCKNKRRERFQRRPAGGDRKHTLIPTALHPAEEWREGATEGGRTQTQGCEDRSERWEEKPRLYWQWPEKLLRTSPKRTWLHIEAFYR